MTAGYALGHLPSLNGELHLIDNDAIDDTNLNRYILMRRSDVGHAKPDVAAAALSGTGLTPLPFPQSFEQFAATHPEPIDLLLTPIDSEAGRRRLVSYLPREVLNAATGNSTVTLSRHGFGDGKACLSCLYLPQGEQLSTEARLAADMGLREDEVPELLALNRPVGRDIVARVERHRGMPEGSLSEFVCQHIQSFYQRAVCGSAPVSTAAGTVVAPVSFISATAGVLLAVELVKRRAAALSRYRLNNYFRIDTLAAPNPAFRQERSADSSGRCICADPDYVSVYRSRFPAPPVW